MVYDGQTVSWAELWREVQANSRFFSAELGHREQKIVSLLMTNSIEFVITYLAVVHAGHIVLPIDPVYKKLEIDAILDNMLPAMLIVHQTYAEQVGPHDFPILYYDKLSLQKKQESKILRMEAAKQIASITFTSGTSGNPKAVPNTHFNHIWNIKVCSKAWDWTAEDTLLITLPLSHWYGIVMGLSGCMYHGNTLYLKQQSFDTTAILEELQSGRISLFTHAPVAYMKMLEVEGDYDLSKVRLFISGSAPFPPKLWQDFKNRFKVEVLETYGSSETGRIAANTIKQCMLGSPGKVLPEVDLRLSHENEVLIKSGGVCPGYWNNPQATKQSMTLEGYWRTGDIGELKQEYLFLKGRVQERIRKFGYTISPRDVEWALLENPTVKEVFVLGRQRPDQPNDEIYFFVSGATIQEDLINYCKANLPFSWRPDKIIFVKAIPRTRNGKPNVAKLKAMAD